MTPQYVLNEDDLRAVVAELVEQREIARLITAEEAAERLAVSPRHVRQLIARRELPVVRVGGAVRVWSSDIDTYIREHRRGVI